MQYSWCMNKNAHPVVRPQVKRHLPSVEQFLRFFDQRQYPSKTVILAAGENSRSLFLILDGSVSVIVHDDVDEDHKMVVSYLNPGDFFGEMGLFEHADVERSAFVETRTACTVAEISYERFHQIRDSYPEILFAVGQQLASRLRHTTTKLRDLAFVDVSGRIAHTLLDLAGQPDAMTHPDGMQIRITRQELGKIAGCSREMAGRVLKSLAADGLISVSGKTIVVFGTR
jgi:CRP/FNR family transcriptional regulator, cyclic AMP receptor protein